MNPIPYGWTMPFSVTGFLALLLVVAVGSVAVMVFMMMWAAHREGRQRVRIFCPVRLKHARVLLGLGATGAPVEVLACSEFGRRTLTCGSACLRTTVA
jgi:hypothetical protein